MASTSPSYQRRVAVPISLTLAVGAVALMLLNSPHPELAPSSTGKTAAVSSRSAPAPASGIAEQPARSALEAYNRGNYAESERAAAPIAERARTSKDPAVRKQGVRARWVMAYSAARRKEFPVARQRFAQLREEAATLPDHGKPEARLGENPPTLEEEGAYEHAVLTSALARQSAVGGGSKQGASPAAVGSGSKLGGAEEGASEGEISQAAAEREFVQFIHDYPESPLVHAAILRVGKMHGGDIPQDAEAVWRESRKLALARQAERERQQSLCAPEVLAEVLRRSAGPADMEALAREMKTDRWGTSLKALLVAAQAHGFQAEGLHLSIKGLRQQLNPAAPGGPAKYVIALIRPGHFVLVEKAWLTGVQIWDPDQGGTGHGGSRALSPEVWQKAWDGVALVLR